MSSKARKFFAAYPASSSVVGDCFKAASQRLKDMNIDLHTWEQNDICGIPLTDPIFEQLSSADALIADITKLNFNVTFEIGFAIAKQKRIFIVKNEGIIGDNKELEQVGIFDTLGYETYENSEQLRDFIYEINNYTPLETKYSPEITTPLYLIELPAQNDFMRNLISRIKKSRLRYKSFNSIEHVRLSARDAIEYVSRSFGTIVPIAPDNMRDSFIHNIRAAFVSGLSFGLQKPTLLIQERGGPMPLDVRDMVKTVNHPDDFKDHISDFALATIEKMQADEELINGTENLLASLSIGDPMAENEFQTLGSYYLKTDEFQRAERGEINLIVGRKGTGKTALFSQVRDVKRSNRKNIVCDLKPEGYQLIRLKEEILEHLNHGSRDYLITAFWEYILYLEIIYKILEKDKDTHIRDHTIHEDYIKLRDLYNADTSYSKGDFSERLSRLSERLVQDFRSNNTSKNGSKLSSEQITNLLYKHDLSALRQELVNYLAKKGEVWILFDNLDKGWPPEGLEKIDVVILRCLIDAGKKIQRELGKYSLTMHCIAFIRNDVYQLLMQNSADFGKEIRVSLDWSDDEQLKELLRRRLTVNLDDPDITMDAAWPAIATPIHNGENSFYYLIERSLMRPRNLIKEVMHCKAAAVNVGHEKILSEDIVKGMLAYSHDVLIEADRELTDIDQQLQGFLYSFISEPAFITTVDLWECLEKHGVPSKKWETAVDYLLYFGFFGIKIGDKENKYIYDYKYNTELMNADIKKNEDILSLCINPAFWPALELTT